MSSSTRTRVLVVDADTALRQGLARELGAHPAIEVVGTAMSVRTAEPKIGNYMPDLVVLDLVSDLDEAIGMMERFAQRPGPLRVVGVVTESGADQVRPLAAKVGCTTLVRRKAATTPQAISELAKSLGEAIVGGVRADALEPAAAPMPSPPPMPASAPVPAPAQRLVSPRATASNVSTPAVPPSPPAVMPTVRESLPPNTPRRARAGIQTPVLVSIGVSTGGPAALQQVIPALPADFPVPIVIVQHMPPGFTKSLADSLDKASKLRVREAGHREPIAAGEVVIAPGGRHLRIVRRDGKLMTELTEDPPECSCRPSVDYLFRSLVAACGSRVLGVVLTGMGEDGWIGSRLLDAAGACLLAQDEASCTVYGMPRGPVEQGIATAVALPAMAAAIDRAARSPSCS